MSGDAESEPDETWVAHAAVGLRDGNNRQVGGAIISVQWSGAFVDTATATTNPGGIAQFATSAISGTSVTITVTAVTHPDFTYDSSLNNVTTIVIVAP